MERASGNNRENLWNTLEIQRRFVDEEQAIAQLGVIASDLEVTLLHLPDRSIVEIGQRVEPAEFRVQMPENGRLFHHLDAGVAHEHRVEKGRP